MKIIITGSLGHISRPLTLQLVQEGHNVTVVSSNNSRSAEITLLGATPAIGSLEDAAFLTKTFTGADAVYTMIPPNNYFDHSLDLVEYYRRLGNNYKQAVQQSGVKRQVHLSTIGAHLSKGNGILLGAHYVEGILDTPDSKVDLTFMRPTSFYYNLYGYMPMIKQLGFIAANYGADDVVPWVSPLDIATAVAEELTATRGSKIRYVCSHEATCSETAGILGNAIGMPHLKWSRISDEESAAGLKAIGMNPQIADGLAEMYAGLHTGLLSEDYFNNRPVMGKVKLQDFAVEFAENYNKGGAPVH